MESMIIKAANSVKLFFDERSNLHTVSHFVIIFMLIINMFIGAFSLNAVYATQKHTNNSIFKVFRMTEKSLMSIHGVVIDLDNGAVIARGSSY